MDTHASDVRRSRHLPLPLAIAFAAWTLLYAVCWMIAVRPGVSVELGFDAGRFIETEHSLVVATVRPNSPAEKMGMRAGDRIAAIDGQPLADANSQTAAWARHRPGDRVRLTILRPGQAVPLSLAGVFRPASSGGLTGSAGYFAGVLRNWFPVPFVVVGLTVLFLRLEDRNAWLLALLFASFLTTTSPGRAFDTMPAFIRPLIAPTGRCFSAWSGRSSTGSSRSSRCGPPSIAALRG